MTSQMSLRKTIKKPTRRECARSHGSRRTGQFLRRLRKAYGWTMEEVGLRNGWSETALIYWETGQRRLTMGYVWCVVKTLCKDSSQRIEALQKALFLLAVDEGIPPSLAKQLFPSHARRT